MYNKNKLIKNLWELVETYNESEKNSQEFKRLKQHIEDGLSLLQFYYDKENLNEKESILITAGWTLHDIAKLKELKSKELEDDKKIKHNKLGEEWILNHEQCLLNILNEFDNFDQKDIKQLSKIVRYHNKGKFIKYSLEIDKKVENLNNYCKIIQDLDKVTKLYKDKNQKLLQHYIKQWKYEKENSKKDERIHLCIYELTKGKCLHLAESYELFKTIFIEKINQPIIN